MISVLLGCSGWGGFEVLDTDSRQLDRFAAGAHTITVTAVSTTFRYDRAFDLEKGYVPAHVTVSVGWELDAGAAIAKGDTQTRWALDPAAGPRRYRELRVERCTSEAGVTAFRVAAPGEGDVPGDVFGARFRAIAPDPAGVAVQVVPSEVGPSCADALAWAGTPEAFRRDRSVLPTVCGHLYRLGERENAVRCLLRPPRTGDAPASRQDLPRAPDDPAFDGIILAALAPGTGDGAGFVPSRVRDLVDPLSDRAAVRALAVRIAGEPTWWPWQAGLVAAEARAGRDVALTERSLAALDRALEGAARGSAADAAVADLVITALGDAVPAARREEIVRRAATVPAVATCPPPATVARGQCADPAAAAARAFGRPPAGSGTARRGSGVD